jgi:RNA polymerase sigma factor (sigma-70 family)
MGAEHIPSAQDRTRGTKPRARHLHDKQAQLEQLLDAQDKKEFFKQIIPLLRPLKSYVKRRLRIAYLTSQIRTPLYTSGDILDEVVLQAYEDYDKKPANVSLEEWLYRLANERLEKYLRKRNSTDRRQKSLETLTQRELRSLEEMPITADAEGEAWFPEELDDSEYERRDFYPPSYKSDPEEQLEREEQVQQIVQALSRVPEQDRVVFELFVVEGFSKEAVARISNVSAEEVPRIAQRVKEQVMQELQKKGAEATDNQKRKAS